MRLTKCPMLVRKESLHLPLTAWAVSLILPSHTRLHLGWLARLQTQPRQHQESVTWEVPPNPWEHRGRHTFPACPLPSPLPEPDPGLPDLWGPKSKRTSRRKRGRSGFALYNSVQQIRLLENESSGRRGRGRGRRGERGVAELPQPLTRRRRRVR